MKRIVLTGAECSGKTEIFKSLTKRFHDCATFIPEVAETLLSRGFPNIDRFLNPWTQKWQDHLQRAIYTTQFAMEETSIVVASKKRHLMLVLDRGLMDGAAFMAGGVEEFETKFGVTAESIYGRYDLVIHLESTASGCPQEYKITEVRTNPREEAEKNEKRIAAAWKHHPHYVHICCEQTFAGKQDKVFARIESFFA
jgi:predicted ATPase